MEWTGPNLATPRLSERRCKCGHTLSLLQLYFAIISCDVRMQGCGAVDGCTSLEVPKDYLASILLAHLYTRECLAFGSFYTWRYREEVLNSIVPASQCTCHCQCRYYPHPRAEAPSRKYNDRPSACFVNHQKSIFTNARRVQVMGWVCQTKPYYCKSRQ